MKKLRKLFALSAFSLVAVSLLAGCGKSYDEDDIKSIAINENTFYGSWIFYLDQVITIEDTLAVDLLDASNTILETVTYVDSPSSFTYTEVDTSELGRFTFTVTYTTSNGVAFEASQEYTVLESSDLDPNYWTMNAQYSSYLTSVDTALDKNEEYYDDGDNFDVSLIYDNDTDLASTSHIRSNGKFYVANHNAVDLSPTRWTILVNYQVGVRTTKMPENTSIEIYAQDDEDHTTNLVDSYFDSDDDYNTACTTGYVDFTDDLTDLETEITVIFTTSASDTFNEFEIDLTLVDGWNITEADQLILMDNAKFSGSSNSLSQRVYDSYLDKKKEVLGTDNVEATTSYETFVLFNDITIEKEDLPTGVIWQEGDTGWNSYLDGTLKDWYFIYEHNMGVRWGNSDSNAFNFYGNYNSIVLGETFPYVVSERSDYLNTEEVASDAVDKVDTHTCLFGSDQSTFTEQIYYSYNFYDVTFIGNQGVATDQIVDIYGTPDDETDDVVGGGILLAKLRADTNFENCNINSFFTIFVTQGEASASAISSEYQIEYNLNYTKMSNFYSSAIFVFGESDVNITNSLLSSAGGPLFILAGNSYEIISVDEEEIEGCNVVVDDKTVLKNLVTGQGGWFDLMGASPTVLELLNIGEIFEEELDKSFVTDRGDGQEALNLIAVCMEAGVESAGALNADMRNTLTIGEKTYLDSTQGKSALDSYIAQALITGINNELLGQIFNALANTTYGSQFFFYLLSGVNSAYSNIYTLPTFMTYDSSNNPYFTTVDTTDGVTFNGIVPVGSYVNNLTSTLGLGNIFPTTVSEGFADGSEYITTYFAMEDSDYSAPSIDASNQDNLLSSAISAYLTYPGSTAYGVVFELFDV